MIHKKFSIDEKANLFYHLQKGRNTPILSALSKAMNRKRNGFCVLYFIAATLVVCQLWNASVIGNVNLVELEKMVRPAVVTIETYDKKGKPLGSSSGFFINKQGELITNYHVLKGAYSARVKTFDGKEYSVKLVLAESETTDLIKVSVDIPEQTVKFIEISKNTPEVGERVIVAHSSLGLKQTVSEGIVSTVQDIPTIGKIFQISAPIYPGSSGSPVLDMEGQVIGIVFFGPWTLKENMGFAVSGEQILALKLWKNKMTLAEWTSRLSEREIDVWNLYLQGLMLIWAGDYEKSLDCIQKVIDANLFSAEAWFSSGCIYGKLTQHNKEIEAYKKIIQIRPVNLREHLILERAYLYLGMTYNELGRHLDAIEAYNQVIRINPDFADAHYNLGNTYFNLGRCSEAAQAYKNVIQIKPDHAEAHYNLGTTYDNLGRYQEEIEAYKQAIRIKPDYAKAYRNLGITYDKLGRYEDAIEAYKQAIHVKPDYLETYLNLGSTYGNLGRYQKAIEAFKQAICVKPDFADAHYNLGITYSRQGYDSQAIESYKGAISANPDYAEAYYNLGTTYRKLGRHQEAIEVFKQAIRIKPDYVETYLNLGSTYGSIGRYQKAVESFKQAIRIKPDYAKAHYNLGLAYLKVGDHSSATDEYRILKDLDKDLANELFNLIYK